MRRMRNTQKKDTNECIIKAEEYYNKGIELFSQKDYPDAAEKIWTCVKTATQALTERYLGRTIPEHNQYWRDFIALAFIKAGLSKAEAKNKANYFIEVREKLHGGCFYGLSYEEIEHKPLIDEAKEYLSEIKKLFNK